MAQDPLMDPLIYDLRGVEYVYGGTHRALQSLYLRIKPGERIAILGSNGSGKSTLLQILDGLLFPTAGEAQAFGKKNFGRPPSPPSSESAWGCSSRAPISSFFAQPS
jgi:ABC-type molybdenum transport system ATPase subunit/photorepair protein PhrA